MPFHLIRSDITKLKVDAIVNAAKASLLGGGGVDGAIHAAAGPELLAYCKDLGGCEVGAAKITPGFRLPAKYVIHTVGPVWYGGAHHEAEHLFACYWHALELAVKHDCKQVAFPLISSGIYGYPKREAYLIAKRAILGFLKEHDVEVFLVIFNDDKFLLPNGLDNVIKQYLFEERVQIDKGIYDVNLEQAILAESEDLYKHIVPMRSIPQDGLDAFLQQRGDTFTDALLRLIDAGKMTDAEVYKRANVDRKLFSKIRNDRHYKPSKYTVIAFAIALSLDMDQTERLLAKAGLALSDSNDFDLIIRYFIEAKCYDLFEINEALFCYNQHLLGL